MDQNLRAAKFAASDVSEMEIEVKVENANEWKDDPIIGESKKNKRTDQIIKPITIKKNLVKLKQLPAKEMKEAK